MENQKDIFETKNNKVVNFISGFAITLLVLLFAAALLYINYFEDETWFLILAGIVVLGCSIGMGILCVKFIRKVVIEVDPEKFTLTKGKKVIEYPLSAFRGTNVTKNYYNGIYTGSTRSVKFEDKNGKIKTMVLNFNADQFSKIAASIDKFIHGKVAVDSDGAEKSSEYFDTERVFDLPAQKMKDASRRADKATTIAGIIIIVLGIIFAIFTGVVMDDVSFPIIIGIILPVTGICILLINKSLVKNCNKYMPEKIIIDSRSIRIDNEVYYCDKIKQIRMTPSSYTRTSGNTMRFLRVEEEGKDKYFLGKISGKEGDKYVYEDYEALFKTIHYWCIQKSVDFRMDLG